MKRIVVEDYSRRWPEQFQTLSAVYANALHSLNCNIQHVGSTSVPGLAAKPVIDIDLIIDDRSKLAAGISTLSRLGYEHMGDMGIADREAFKRLSPKTPRDGSDREWPAHNLYVCIDGSVALRNHLALRDYLRANPLKTKEYGALKKNLAAENPFDMDLYIRNKTPFITEILKTVGFEEAELNSIRKANGA